MLGTLSYFVDFFPLQGVEQDMNILLGKDTESRKEKAKWDTFMEKLIKQSEKRELKIRSRQEHSCVGVFKEE